MALLEIAIIDVGLIGQRIARLPARACGQEGKLILRRLRDRIDARPILLEQLHRRRGRRAETVRRAGKSDMVFGLIAAGAEIGVEPSQLRGRIIAPPGIVDGVGGDVTGQIADLAAGLHRRADAAVGTAAHFALDAVIGESVLHFERQRAADRIEPVDRIAGNQRHAD